MAFGSCLSQRFIFGHRDRRVMDTGTVNQAVPENREVRWRKVLFKVLGAIDLPLVWNTLRNFGNELNCSRWLPL